MTNVDPVQAAAALGFTERQARFLAVAALHSGYCVRRHYAQWASISDGGVAAEFFDKLVARQIATRIAVGRNRGYCYHLSSPALYAALGDPHNRNRRTHPGWVIGQRLMILDFVLTRRDAMFVATEHDKVRLLVEDYSIARDLLPSKTYRAVGAGVAPTVRYFVEKLPIFVSTASRVWVGYVLTERTADGFRTFLSRYGPLLNALPRAGVVLIAPSSHGAVAMCARAFDEVTRGRVRRHFHARQAWERRAYADFTPDRVRQLKADLRQFSSRPYEALYRHWTSEGDAALNAAGAPILDVLPAFEVFPAPYAYEYIAAVANLHRPVSRPVRR
jgi:hypothetical protein